MITSLTNSRLKHIRELNEKRKTRNKEGLFIIEGVKMFLESPVKLIKEVYISDTFDRELKECDHSAPLSFSAMNKLNDYRSQGGLFDVVDDEVFRKCSDTETPQGIMCVVAKPHYELKDILGGNILILENLQDPGNLGTMVRTGEGAGISGILLNSGCVDIFNPKTVRSTMGSIFRVPFVYTGELKEAVDILKENDVRVYAAHLKGQNNYDEIEYGPRSAFMIGNEGNGLTDEAAEMADEYLKIPMGGKLESLNAAMAAGILMYHARLK